MSVFLRQTRLWPCIWFKYGTRHHAYSAIRTLGSDISRSTQPIYFKLKPRTTFYLNYLIPDSNVYITVIYLSKTTGPILYPILDMFWSWSSLVTMYTYFNKSVLTIASTYLTVTVILPLSNSEP